MPSFSGHVVLEQPVDDDDVRAEQLLVTGDLLAQRQPVVGDELEVEVRNADACVALARGRLTNITPATTEAEVAALDRVEQHRPVDLLRRGEAEGGVALKLGQSETGPQRRDDRANQVGEDVLRVIDLDRREVLGIAADVGDQQADGLGRIQGRATR